MRRRLHHDIEEDFEAMCGDAEYEVVPKAVMRAILAAVILGGVALALGAVYLAGKLAPAPSEMGEPPTPKVMSGHDGPPLEPTSYFMNSSGYEG